jgi:hypothetical protein
MKQKGGQTDPRNFTYIPSSRGTDNPLQNGRVIDAFDGCEESQYNPAVRMATTGLDTGIADTASLSQARRLRNCVGRDLHPNYSLIATEIGPARGSFSFDPATQGLTTTAQATTTTDTRVRNPPMPLPVSTATIPSRSYEGGSRKRKLRSPPPPSIKISSPNRKMARKSSRRATRRSATRKGSRKGSRKTRRNGRK